MSIYLQYPDTKGSISSKGFEGWIEIHSMQKTANRNIAPTEAGRGNDRQRGTPKFHAVQITKPIDQSSAKLYQDFATGKVAPKVLVHVTNTDDGLKPYLEYTLHNVYIGAIDKQIDGVDPHEIVSMSYSKIEERFTGTDSNMRNSSAQSVGYDAEVGEVM